MLAGHLDGAFFAVYVGQMSRTATNYAVAQAVARSKLAAIHRMAEKLYPAKIEIAYSVRDIRRIHGAGKLIALIGIENGFAIGTDVSLLEEYFELGVRYMTLAHTGHNDLADSSNPIAEFGDGRCRTRWRKQARNSGDSEMNRLGMLVDVSHLSRNAVLEQYV